MQAERRPTAIYSPSYRVGASPTEAMAHWARVLRKDRWQIWTAFSRNFKSNARDKVLGFVWQIVLPLVPVSVYMALALMQAFPMSGQMPHVLFLCIGITVYGLATGPIQDTLSALQSEASVLARSDVSFLTPILSRFGQLVWDTLVRAVAIVVMLIAFGINPGLNVLWLPLVLAPVILLGLGLGILASIANLIAKDVANVVAILIRYGFFFSAVVFPLPRTGMLGDILKFNPFCTYVNEVRDLVVFGRFESPPLYFATAAFSLVVFFVAMTLLYRAEPRLRMALT
jgi:ABC-type polysaccharide/polyol phosphate export permease